MRVLVAPDKLAGSLTSLGAAAAIADGWRRGDPAAVVAPVGLSDGGPGFVEVLHRALGGRLLPAEVTGPVGVPVPASVLVVDDAGRRTAYVESAQACGLALVDPSPETARGASTHGVGELLLVALREGADRVVVGVGGTATTDGGRGCLDAVGGAWPVEVVLEVATDVTAPLLGPSGAARVFAPQKGADEPTVAELEVRLEAWAATRAGTDATTPGAGAGGGLAFGLLALGGRVVGGADTVMTAARLRDRVSVADLVVTAEGRFDASSLLGKAPVRVAAAARELGRPCVVLAGDRDVPDEDLEGVGVSELRTLVEAYGRAEALAHPAERLADLAELVARGWAEHVPRV